MRKLELNLWYHSNADLFNVFFESIRWPRVDGVSQTGARIERKELEMLKQAKTIHHALEEIGELPSLNDALSNSLRNANALVSRLNTLMYEINPYLSEQIRTRVHTSALLYKRVHVDGCYRDIITRLIRFENCIEYILTPLAKLFYCIALQIVTYDACDFSAAETVRENLMDPIICAKIMQPCLRSNSTNVNIAPPQITSCCSAIYRYLEIHHGKRVNVLNRAAIPALTAVAMLMRNDYAATV
jgi:hypothetical protein